MVRCRHGHSSETPDFCDECGVPIEGAPPASATPSAGTPSAPPSPGATAAPAAPPSPPEFAGEVCPLCGTPRTGRFCEEDGHDFVVSGAAPAAAAPVPAAPPSAAPAAPAPAAPATGNGPPAESGWVLTVEADRRYYESVLAREGPDIGEVSFPNYYPRAEIPLAGAEVRVGRRRVHGSTPAPQVDLAGPPLDPGVSHLHAVLLPLPDADGAAGWSVLDPGSTNGTTINYSDEPIALDTVIPLREGDRVHVGAFTTLLLERR
ncbi:FHA domain-containing protein [Actinomycetospora endophytica]|uniref:FHA domain-containing protein n=1 Tax=Actinomycetospora endophytica TaxID=2291215 RepID=A0ABS8PCC6_9PSEU|nr:FHA domain-containing protein [Actinomycetospora endophytica]MCD2195923.1 FHA domain-containing protein [Actinomycetospora endophytica]